MRRLISALFAFGAGVLANCILVSGALASGALAKSALETQNLDSAKSKTTSAPESKSIESKKPNVDSATPKPSADSKTLDEKVHALLRAPLEQNHRIYSVFGEKEVELKIQAILNRQVLIHHKWYKQGDKIGSFFIHDIKPYEVVLIDKKSQQKTLSIRKKVLE
ncbi:hypothetical protein BKN38_09350 [Helicobacter sp. CLO-3]|uniref:hypothetical protein n=1 Tax=unclassified Helicobacter TaxID=2593540 RepID=UPI00080600F8|nr:MULTISPECIES: hypothetical protein [unclassified Helicobacter]OBV28632.1 hypothetical protein BA723_01830 [Helicobacter sp. CLO-3]OHU81293.1 hypothetical protein BKN38_09350 [Helicobacter sp. CLO-3]